MDEERLIGKVYKDGEIILREGSTSREMYVIQSGKVLVAKGDVVLATLGEGEIFGEISLLDGQPRSASVKALGDVRVLVIDQVLFLRKIRSDPFLALRLLRQMGTRIRELDKMMSTALGNADRHSEESVSYSTV